MANMPIPTDLHRHTDEQTLLTLGLRATWLHLHLTGEAGLILSPREREVLVLVATSPRAVPEHLLLRRMHDLGVTAGTARRVLTHLTHGWLSVRDTHEELLYDLPQEDLDYIHTQARCRSAA